MNPQFADFSACMYDGHTDPTKFIEFFKISSLVNSWDAAAQLENVTIFLKDKALQLHNDLATKTQISHIYDELKLKCSPRPESQMFAFNTRKIANNETITKYGTELAKLLKGANPGLTAAQSLISIKAQLRVNLPPNSNINLLLQIHKDKALIDLLAELDDAIQVPGNTATSDSSSTLWNDRPTATVKTEPSESHFTNSSQLNDRSRAGQNSNQQSIPRFAGNCNYCGIYGHRYAQCLKRGRDEIQNNNNNSNNSSMQGNYRPPIQNRTTGQNNSSSSSSSSSYTPSRNGTNQNNHSRQSQGQQSYNQSNRPNYGYNQHSGTTYNFNNRRPTTQSSNNYTEQNDNGKNDQEDNNQCSYNAQSDQCHNAENNNNSCNNNNNNMQSSAENFNIETTEEFPYFSFHSESSQIEISADLKPVVLDFPFFLPKSLSLEQRTEVFNTEITDTLEQQPPTASNTPDNVNVIEIVQGSRNNTSLNVSIVMASLSDRMTSFNSVALLDNTCPHSFLSPDVICDEVLLSLESRKECHRFISIKTNGRVRNIQCFSLIATLITDNWEGSLEFLIKQTQADGSVKYRFCVDLRKVNAVTARDSYNLPRINETVNKLNGMMFFSNGDIDRAFWQVGVVEKDKCKHAFNVDGTLYEGNVMSFGSMNAPATFQRLMDTILKGLTWKQCLAYIDDILIFSKTLDTHLQHIDEVLTRIKNAGLKLKPSKCSFGTHEVEYLGFKISDQGIQPSQRKVERLLQVKPPKTPALLHSYLCSINFYRQDIPHFGHITSELHDMAASKTRFLTWTNTALRHFSRLQNAFANAPILAFPDFDKTFYIQGDASAKAVGGACLQKHGCSTPLQNSNNCIFRPNVFFGRKLTKTERRWSATERETLALVYGYTICYHLVFGRKIVFLTDHKPLSTLNNVKTPFGRLGQLLFKLEGVDYSIEYIEGSKNYLLDFLSRAHFAEPSDFITSTSMSILVSSSIDWAKEQAKDEELLRVIACIRKNVTDIRWNNVKDELVHYNRMSHYYAREPECEKPDQLNISTNKRQFAVQKHNAQKTTDKRNLFLYASSIARANKKRVEMCRIHQVADANAAANSHPPGEGINNDVVDNQHSDSFDENEPILPSDNQLESFHSFRQAHEEENRSHNEALEDSPTVNNEILPFNANGKEQVLCPHCLPIKKLCEKATGLRTHIRHCHPNVMATNGLLSTPLQVRNDNQAKQLLRPEASSTREGEGL
jgi:hypothetical protein